MRGEIARIHPPKTSRHGGEYIRVEFKMEDGGWAKTDLVYGFRNYKRWLGLLHVGEYLGNLTMKGEDTVDADSSPGRVDRV